MGANGSANFAGHISGTEAGEAMRLGNLSSADKDAETYMRLQGSFTDALPQRYGDLRLTKDYLSLGFGSSGSNIATNALQVNFDGIGTDGSITAAGDVICGGYVPGNVNTYGIRLNASANQVAIRTATSSTATAFKITGGGSDTAVITTAGSATFAGSVQSGGNAIGGTAVGSVVRNGKHCFNKY